MKLLVLTTEPITATRLNDALPGDVDPADAEVMLVAPALSTSALRFWVSDADQAIQRADWVRRESVDQLGDAGVSAAADTGEGDVLEAIQDALQTFAADRIVVFAHPPDEQRHGEEVDDAELRERFGLPVDRAEIAPRD
ncbi:MAG: hypothetical protein ACR2GZ_11205 [Solirubrobacteraceae bacterium]